ncbi:MAG: hypothetical protein KJZ86_06355 [Caldilineaceae bacterium]|nr:hypothetical protein [Caldilineaceae bacterium]
MAAQDDLREREMCRLIGLRRGEGRSNVDAFLDFEISGETYSSPVELKSTTTHSVSTARDVGPSHIEKWRSRIWVFGFYDSTGITLQRILTLGPSQMEPWIRKIERYIAPDFAIGERAANRLDMQDLHIICGEKPQYDLDDAISLHKRQWTKDQYLAEMDIPNAYTPEKFLQILKLRALYLNQRGSTLNNPHIPGSFFSSFLADVIDAANTSATEIALLTQTRIRQITLNDENLRRTK